MDSFKDPSRKNPCKKGDVVQAVIRERREPCGSRLRRRLGAVCGAHGSDPLLCSRRLVVGGQEFMFTKADRPVSRPSLNNSYKGYRCRALSIISKRTRVHEGSYSLGLSRLLVPFSSGPEPSCDFRSSRGVGGGGP